MKTQNLLYFALNSQQAFQPSSLGLAAALCFEIPAGDLPEWVPLVPVGEVKGRDGRAWTNPDPLQVIANTQASNREQPLDYEHSTDLKAPKGEPAPAAGWFAEYRVANGFIEGRLQLNPNGLASVKNREYRYLSPVFRYTADGVIFDITSAGLTNKPNLLLPALNQEVPSSEFNPSFSQPQEYSMTLEELLAALRAALGAGDGATVEELLAGIKALKGKQETHEQELQEAQNRQLPSLDKYVPRGDYDAVLMRASNAEQQLANAAKAELETAINHEIEQAIAAGKIAPGSKGFYEAACRQEGGLDSFKAFVASAPQVVGAGVTGGLPNTETALNHETQTLAALFGNSVDDLKTHGGLGQPQA